MAAVTETRMRFLASLCQHAKGKQSRCTCRCNGLLHGMEHGSDWIQDQIDAEWISEQVARDGTSRAAGQQELFGG